MQRPNLSPIVVAAVAGLVLVVAGLAALVSFRTGPTPDGTPGPSDGPSAEPSHVAVIDAASCPLQEQPGPEDTVPKPGGDGIDVADLGNGRWRLCLGEPIAIEIEGSAWCTWNDDRATVREVMGLPVSAGVDKIDGGVGLDRGAVYLSVTSAAGDMLSYEDTDPRQVIEPAGGGRAGAARFRLDATTDPEHPPAVRPPAAAGTMRWACGDPPAPRPGRSAGTATLRLDAPIALSWDIPVTCSWSTIPAGARLHSVESVRPIPVGDREISLFVGPNVNRPDDADAQVSVTAGEESGSYTGGGQISMAQSPDAATGVLRLRHLGIEPESKGRLGPAIDEVSGAVRWSCPPPAVAAPVDPDAGPPQAPPDTTTGRARMTFDPAVAPPIEFPVTCGLDRSDPSYLRVATVDGQSPLAGGMALLHADTGTVRLALVGGDGWPAGEYAGQAFEIADELTVPGLLIGIRELAWDSKDPRYVPLGGAAAPKTIGLTIGYACDLSRLELPGLSSGRMELTIGSGVDKSWSVATFCTWRIRDGRPTVTEVVNADPLEILDEPFRAYAVPNILFVNNRFGTRYGKGNNTILQGSVVPDGSNGRWAFTGVGPLGGIPNVNGRLGGRNGPLSVDGTIAWTCGRPPTNIPPEVPPG